MSVRRRASIAGLDFTKDLGYQSSSVSGNGFGRRMSIASLGSHKYGRAEDHRHSNNGGGRGGAGLVVRHIPIVVEGDDQDGSVSSHLRCGRSVDRSSTSSTESDNSVDTGRHTLASATKTAGPRYVLVEETVGADHCPVHGHHHHHHHHHHPHSQEGKRRQNGVRGVAGETGVFADQLKAPGLIRSSVTPDNRKLTSGSQRARSRPSIKPGNNVLAPIKENVSQDTFQRNFRQGGSFRGWRGPSLGDDQEEAEEKQTNKTFQRRWSVRLPSQGLEPRQSQRETAGGGGAGQVQTQPCVGILKTPGKRKTSNNRVEFLDNLQEREIPSRHT